MQCRSIRTVPTSSYSPSFRLAKRRLIPLVSIRVGSTFSCSISKKSPMSKYLRFPFASAAMVVPESGPHLGGTASFGSFPALAGGIRCPGRELCWSFPRGRRRLFGRRGWRGLVGVLRSCGFLAGAKLGESARLEIPRHAWDEKSNMGQQQRASCRSVSTRKARGGAPPRYKVCKSIDGPAREAFPTWLFDTQSGWLGFVLRRVLQECPRRFNCCDLLGVGFEGEVAGVVEDDFGWQGMSSRRKGFGLRVG